jgi:hypothetical protein
VGCLYLQKVSQIIDSSLNKNEVVQYFTPFASKNRLVTSRKASYLLPDFHSSSSIKDESCAGIAANGTIQTSPTGKYLVVSTGRAILSTIHYNLSRAK